MISSGTFCRYFTIKNVKAGNRNLLKNYRSVKNTTMSVAVVGVRFDIKETGTVRMIFKNDGELETVDVLNVLYSPKLRRNLISGSLIDKTESTFMRRKGQINAYAKDGYKLFTAEKVESLFCVNPKIDVNHKSKNVRENYTIWNCQ
ncbi:hypothetical protein AVEN_226046-1 [Araneus ventricosus]|uniref:Retrovirus-related Pol polyprotein from transposon TNT 1-94-like beta-barrel domain-containing protein n=1 Tax=Araneus ventricosus TaxID=182803 RepID=A0A4Y2IK80_ARAVE|nr:hypothetical protein AVEN_226046-1 [Araneus ventricosus]